MAYMNFCAHCPYFFTDLDDIRYTFLHMPLNRPEFRESRCTESRILLKAVNESLPLFSTFILRFIEYSAQETSVKKLSGGKFRENWQELSVKMYCVMASFVNICRKFLSDRIV
jgi:hypothetical protein